MDILKRKLAPLTDMAWDEIDNRAKDVFHAYLSARRFIDIEGPKGWDYGFVSEGRLTNIHVDEKSGVNCGLYKGKPLIETRVEFGMDQWEMDNIIRGARDINFDSLEEAVKKIALFEENAIYKGMDSMFIEGLTTIKDTTWLEFGKGAAKIMEAILYGIIELNKSYASRPYMLVVGWEAWKRLNAEVFVEPLINKIEELLQGKIVYSHVVEGAILVPYNSKDLNMVVGQDFSIGYKSHTDKKITLFVTESFTFQILNKNIIFNYKM